MTIPASNNPQAIKNNNKKTLLVQPIKNFETVSITPRDICRFLNLEPKKIRAAVKSPQLQKCLWGYGKGRNYRQYLSILKKSNCS